MENLTTFGEQKYTPSTYEAHTKRKNLNIFFSFIYYSIIFIVIGVIKNLWNFLFGATNMKNISGKIALVTGGANGLGRDICIELAKKKCHIAIVDVDAKGARATVEEIRSMGVKAEAYEMDITNYKGIVAVREKIIQDLGYVDILINNAALVPLISFQEGTPEDIERILNVNLLSHFWTTRVFLKDMLDRETGHIVAISSFFGLFGFARHVTYCATKFGVRGLMDGLHEEIESKKLSKKIHTTTIYPCVMTTRKEITDVFSKLKIMDRIFVVSPKYVAKVTVNAIKANRKNVSIPQGLIAFVSGITLLPSSIRKNIIDLITDGDLPELFST